MVGLPHKKQMRKNIFGAINMTGKRKMFENSEQTSSPYVEGGTIETHKFRNNS
jgi:hypothetical protein